MNGQRSEILGTRVATLRRWPSLQERMRRIGARCVRLPTGIPTLDENARGGIPMGIVVTLQGPPGSGKTMLANQWAFDWATAGREVRILAADEGADGWCVRLGQLAGFDRTALEDGVEDARRASAAALEGLPLDVVDADESDACIEDVVSTLSEPGVLVVDLVQTARCRGTDRAESAKERVDAVMTNLKSIANRAGHLVLALSEVNRGSYRSYRGDRGNKLAAGKESGAIESRSSVLLDFEPIDGLIEVSIPKRRAFIGDRPFRLALDPARARFVEVPPPPPPRSRAAVKADAIIDAVGRLGEVANKTAIYNAVRGTKRDVLRLIDDLVEDGRLSRDGATYRLGEAR